MVSYMVITTWLILGLGMIDGESIRYNLDVEGLNYNGSFCPGEVVFTCTGQEAPIIFDWFIDGSPVVSYFYGVNDIFPQNVIESPVNITITSASGLSTINIVSTMVGNFSYLNGTFIQCGRNPILSDRVYVEHYELGAINVSSVQSYGENLMIDTITAVWERLVSTQCPMLVITYEIALKNSSNYTIKSVPNNCLAMDLCMQEIDVPEPFYEEYFLEITATTSGSQGITSLQRTQAIAGRVNSPSNSLDFDVISSRCLESITCVSSISRRCEVRMGSSLSAAMSMDTSVNGSINSSISTSFLSLDRRNTIYYVARFEVTEMIIIEVDGNFSDIQVAVKLSGWNAAFIAVGVILSVISLLLIIVIVIAFAFIFSSKQREKRILFYGIIIVSAIACSIDVILWIVTAAVVAPQEDTCDTNWQSQRDDLIVADFIISIVCTIISVLSIILLLYSYFHKTDGGSSNSNTKAKEIVQSGVDVKEVKIDPLGRTDAELNMTQFHRQVGEQGTATEVQLKTQENLTNAIKEEQFKESREDEKRKAELEKKEKRKKKKNLEKEEHHYHTTEFAMASTGNPVLPMHVTDPPTEYSGLNRPENTKKNDYHHLQFENNSRTPPQNPVPDTKEVYNRLNADSSGNESGERSTAIAMSSNSSKSKPRKGNQLPPSGQPINSTDTAEDKRSKTNIPPKVSFNRISPEQR